MSGSHPAHHADFDVVPLDETHLAEVLRVLGDAFGPGFDTNWFGWKHRDGPWGPSLGWVGLDSVGILGVRLLLPWRFRGGESSFLAFRPCDTVTVPRARSRGVFRVLTEHAIRELEGRCDLFFNTPNESSRPGYLKMGFTEWTVVRQYLGLVSPQQSRLAETAGRDLDPGQAVRTDPGPGFFQWRYLRCPRYEYRAFSLESGSNPTGIVYRVRKGSRGHVIVVAELWGQAAERKALIRAVAALERIRLVWVSSQDRDVVRVVVRRGGTLVTHRPAGTRHLPRPAFSVGDIEDVI